MGWPKGRKRGHMPETLKALKLVGTMKDGKRVSIREAAKVCGISYVTLFRAMKNEKAQ